MTEGPGGAETPLNMTVHLIILEPFSLLAFSLVSVSCIPTWLGNTFWWVTKNENIVE